MSSLVLPNFPRMDVDLVPPRKRPPLKSGQMSTSSSTGLKALSALNGTPANRSTVSRMWFLSAAVASIAPPTDL